MAKVFCASVRRPRRTCSRGCTCRSRGRRDRCRLERLLAVSATAPSGACDDGVGRVALVRAGLGVPKRSGRLVAVEVRREGGRGRHIHRRGEELEHQLAAEPDPLRVGGHLHAGLGLARAGRGQDARALDLDHAHAAHVDRRQVVGEAERRGRHAGDLARVEQGRAFRHRHLGPVDGELDRARRRRHRQTDHRFSSSSRSLATADSIALDAVWPRPQIDASRMA